jgi:exosortase
MSQWRRASMRTVWAAVLVTAGVLILYFDVLADLVSAWANDDNYSHGFLIVPVAAYLVWERRARLRTAKWSPSNWGLLLVGVALAVLTVGTVGAELFLTRVSLLGVIVGVVLFLCGPAQLRIFAFPIAFLLLMIPLPAIIFNQIAFPLQLLATRFGVGVLHLGDIPVLREGNIIVLANTTLEVAEACSGIRSLVSLLTVGILYGYFVDRRFGVRVGIALTTVPIAIVANGIRVAGTGVAAHVVGPSAADGFFHGFSGWIVFLISFLMLLIVERIVRWIAPMRTLDPGAQPRFVES